MKLLVQDAVEYLISMAISILGILGLWVFWPWILWARVFRDFGYFGFGYFWAWVFCPATKISTHVLANCTFLVNCTNSKLEIFSTKLEQM